MAPDDEVSDRGETPNQPERRAAMGAISSGVMAGGLLAGYGTFAAHACRYLYPDSVGKSMWQYVARIDQMKIGEALPFKTPAGAKIVVARQTEGDTAESFIALSSVCPHLGCAVHWEPQNNRFFCPCHNGAFDAAGKATEGPPAAANQVLKQFPLKVENELLFIELPTESISSPETA